MLHPFVILSNPPPAPTLTFQLDVVGRRAAMHHRLMACHWKKERVGDVWWGGGGRRVGGGGVLAAFCCFIATSAHYEEDNELGNFGRGEGGPLTLKTSPILSRGGSNTKANTARSGR